MPLIHLRVEPCDPPQRVDSYLANSEIGISRSQLKRLFGEGRVFLDGKKVRVSFLVSGGEEIEIDRPEERAHEFRPENIPIEIIYEDDDLAVVNKPAGMVTHPAYANPSGTLANALLYHFTQLSRGYKKGFPGLVHRLDKNTTGLLVVAKNDETHTALGKQLHDRTLRREYLALVWGTLNPPAGTIAIPIGRSRADRRIVTSGSPKLREAITHYESLEDLGIFSYIKLRLQTGRTHQIRAHMKETNHPVVGDPEYGGRESRLSGIEARHRLFAKQVLTLTERQLLHAARVEFVHPKTGFHAEFSVDPPADFRQVLEVVRQYRG